MRHERVHLAQPRSASIIISMKLNSRETDWEGRIGMNGLRLAIIVSMLIIAAGTQSARGAGNSETSALPLGSFAIERGWHDVVFPLAQTTTGPAPMSLVLIAAQPFVEAVRPAPLVGDDDYDPYAPPKPGRQVEASMKFDIGGRELPEWGLSSRRTAYVISYDTLKRNPSFAVDHFSLRVELRSEAEAVAVTVLAMPDFMTVVKGAVAGYEGPLDGLVSSVESTELKDYFGALRHEISGEIAPAYAAYGRLAASSDAPLGRLARRGLRMIEYLNRPHKLSGNIMEHYRWGLYLQCAGLASAAFSEFDETRVIDPSHVESQYRGGETRERTGGDLLEVVQYLNRTAEMSYVESPSVWNAVVVIVKSRGAKTLDEAELIRVKDQFTVLDRVLCAASRGCFRLNFTFFEVDQEDAGTMTRHLGRVTGPSDDFVQARGWFDVVFCVRPRIEGENREQVDIGFTDVGPNGAGIASFYHDSSFTAHMRSMYTLLYSAAAEAGQTAGWPDPAGALACGFQPMRFASSAFRSAMRYELFPGDFRRLCAADEATPATYLKLWSIQGPIPTTPRGPGATADTDWIESSEAKSTPIVSVSDFIDLAARFPDAGAATVKATNWVFSPQRQSVWIRLGRNDRATLSINGRRVIAAPSIVGGKFEGRDLVNTAFTRETLEEGWNEFELVVSSRPSEKNRGWGFSVSVVSDQKTPIPGLACVFERPVKDVVPRQVPPSSGIHYKWSDVKDDPRRLLPKLTARELRDLAGAEVAIRTTGADASYVAIELTGRKADANYRPVADYLNDGVRDFVLNNILDWSRENFAMIRCGSPDAPRDLLLVRPEAMEAATVILRESSSAKQRFADAGAADRVLGWIEVPSLGCVFVMDVCLGDAGRPLPVDEEDILSPFGKFIPNSWDEFMVGPPAAPVG